jgi:hypothetical protein
MSWELRTVYETKVGEASPEDTILISGRLHGPNSCICEQCIALEQTAAIVGELLAPGEVRQIAIEGTGLHLTVKRHNPVMPHPKRQPASVPRLAPGKRAPQSRPGVQPAFISSVKGAVWYR